MRVEAIQIGTRHRRNMGDVDTLAASMREIGLLHPIVVRPDGMLIAGERRLRAARQLGWKEIPATVVDLDAVVKGEFAENLHRKDFTLSEAVAIKRALEPIERAAAKKRMLAGKPSEKFSEGGNALDKVAAVVGKHRTTLAKAEAIVDAAEAEPERFGKLLADMDRTGRVNGVFRRLKIAKQAELIRTEPPPLPGNGPYRVIVVDPPWPYGPAARTTHQNVACGPIRQCRLPKFALCQLCRSRTMTACSGCGPRISTCAKPLACSMPGVSSRRRS
jgi:ParB/RepB/Spo0J family partition protein